jgi:hypothetical protein
MSVQCTIEQAELEGDYGTVDGITVTCSRCGHATESYGTHAGSIRRCLALLREECPKGQRNYYVAEGADAAAPPRGNRQTSVEEAYERGKREGYAEGHAAARTNGDGGQFNQEQLRAMVTLCHPDRHPPERFDLANRVTAKLLSLIQSKGKGRKR